ncbi:hypothetical protein MNBD_GAMMA15-1698 [hydrothermal vent metagenome]|uniref:HTH cro/C1-type domain-containing protein n=1 Tax=hydrothermal vent metagenome TaxID=652676 RepID=A0A3B0Y6H4_9ZZZZ
MNTSNYANASTEANIRRTLSLNLRLLRLLKGWSQEQLAECSGLHRTYIGAVERQEINIGVDNLQRLAKALGTPLTTLLNPGCLDLPDNIRETAPTYRGKPYEDIKKSPLRQRHNVVDMRQFAIFRLWTILSRSRVMTSHDSQCKEATGPAGTTDAYPARLVTGSTRRAQRA